MRSPGSQVEHTEGHVHRMLTHRWYQGSQRLGQPCPHTRCDACAALHRVLEQLPVTGVAQLDAHGHCTRRSPRHIPAHTTANVMIIGWDGAGDNSKH